MIGGIGDDIFYVDNASDKLRESAGEGFDTAYSSISFSLGGIYVERLVLTGTAIRAVGNSLANTLVGNAEANQLDGQGGADVMQGGAGDDTYSVDDAGDSIVENGNEGTDTVRTSSVNVTLAANVENLVFGGSAVLNGTGNALANLITGNAAANVIDGLGGADTMKGGGGNDTYYVDDSLDTVVEGGNEGTDHVFSSASFSIAGQHVENLTLTGSAAIDGTGNGLDNSIVGNGANNVLDGATGADRLEGGAGDDTYVVDSLGDVVVDEDGDSANDTVRSSVGTYTIPTGVGTLVMTDSAYWANGNELANVIIGSDRANVLSGHGGLDTLIGGGGDDHYLYADGAQVIEEANGGIDTVTAAGSYTLGANVENLRLAGEISTVGTGNGLDNHMRDAYAEFGSSTLYGLGGNDTFEAWTDSKEDRFYGGAGDDTYLMNQGSVDRAFEAKGEGTDTVISTGSFSLSGQFIENLTLTGAGNIYGNSLNNILIGSSTANRIRTYEGNDHIYGRGGSDSLGGGIGMDSFYFDTALGSGNVDTIDDFSVADDTIMLARAVFSAIEANGTLSSDAFVTGTSAADANDRIVYDSATGKIFYDADGSGGGAAILFAQVTAGTALTNLDFQAYTPPA
jgi:Ca2+-binding RTX toxin-like protein